VGSPSRRRTESAVVLQSTTDLATIRASTVSTYPGIDAVCRLGDLETGSDLLPEDPEQATAPSIQRQGGSDRRNNVRMTWPHSEMSG